MVKLILSQIIMTKWLGVAPEIDERDYVVGIYEAVWPLDKMCFLLDCERLFSLPSVLFHG